MTPIVSPCQKHVHDVHDEANESGASRPSEPWRIRANVTAWHVIFLCAAVPAGLDAANGGELVISGEMAGAVSTMARRKIFKSITVRPELALGTTKKAIS